MFMLAGQSIALCVALLLSLSIGIKTTKMMYDREHNPEFFVNNVLLSVIWTLFYVLTQL